MDQCAFLTVTTAELQQTADQLLSAKSRVRHDHHFTQFKWEFLLYRSWRASSGGLNRALPAGAICVPWPIRLRSVCLHHSDSNKFRTFVLKLPTVVPTVGTTANW